MPAGYTHHASETCDDCGVFVCWTPSPKTLERQTLNSFKLARLVKCDRLTLWERSFVRDVSKLTKLSPRQEALVQRLARQYLEGGAP